MYRYDKATCAFIIPHYNTKIPTNLIKLFFKFQLIVQLLCTGSTTHLTFSSHSRHAILAKTSSETSHSNSPNHTLEFVFSVMVAPTPLCA